MLAGTGSVARPEKVEEMEEGLEGVSGGRSEISLSSKGGGKENAYVLCVDKLDTGPMPDQFESVKVEKMSSHAFSTKSGREGCSTATLSTMSK